MGINLFLISAFIVGCFILYRNYRTWMFIRQMRAYNRRMRAYNEGVKAFTASYKDGVYHA
ncbi:hypothetical protein HOS22_gp02 [Rhizobium phage RHEph08]|uniref:Uncharacterized protein n=3 Tax=Cuernavacavirus TaxID=2731935 RepID=L7TRZ6_9CAUD|nr:hypothetical protein HOS21_gp04 [Rhizobium phage RHEph02]YP_009793185.1 hypothetical protein HOS22_gp02 [Rhizobium phage RHEph08]AGC35571.1 hypothetical protein RHEph02_gp004 [Rhizobium phage RHEph02]AGC35631.1 hypothetical protein RHEph03_gp004 [Rhizobium phage RHEph03]AGC35926.1 hypothetical protein RHEph08_gp002 [Rhizobium phage RHEph08]